MVGVASMGVDDGSHKWFDTRSFLKNRKVLVLMWLAPALDIFFPNPGR